MATQIWDFNQEIDTPKSFEAFLLYLRMGRSRSLEKVAEECRKNASLINRWSAKGNWVERVLQYDLYQDRLAQQRVFEQECDRHKQRLEDFRFQNEILGKNLFKTGTRLLLLSEEKIKSLESGELSVPEMIGLIRIAIALFDTGSKLIAESLGIGKLLENLTLD